MEDYSIIGLPIHNVYATFPTRLTATGSGPRFFLLVAGTSLMCTLDGNKLKGIPRTTW